MRRLQLTIELDETVHENRPAARAKVHLTYLNGAPTNVPVKVAVVPYHNGDLKNAQGVAMLEGIEAVRKEHMR